MLELAEQHGSKNMVSLSYCRLLTHMAVFFEGVCVLVCVFVGVGLHVWMCVYNCICSVLCVCVCVWGIFRVFWC